MSQVKFPREFLDNYLKCQICKNFFERPKALPCLHTFCQRCLENHISNQKVPLQGVFGCPTCLKQTVYPMTRSAGFPDNHLIISLTDLIENKSKSVAAAKLAMKAKYCIDLSDTDVTDLNPTESENISTMNSFHELEPQMTNFEASPSFSQETPRAAAPKGPHKYLATTQVVAPDSPRVNPPPYNPTWSKDEKPPPYTNPSPTAQNLPLPVFDQSAAFLEDPAMIAYFGQYGPENHQLTFPLGLTTVNENIIVSDQRDNRILIYSQDGRLVSMFCCQGNIHCAIGSSTGVVVVATTNVGSALAISYDLSGRAVKFHGNLFSHENPFGITLTPNGDIVTVDLENCCINSINPHGKLNSRFNKQYKGRKILHTPFHIGYMPLRDMLLISDSEANNIKMFKKTGEYVQHFGGEFGKPSQLCHPRGLCVDTFGNIIVADFGHHCIKVFDPIGQLQSTIVKYPAADNAQNTLRPINVTLGPNNKLVVLVVAFGFAQVRIYNYEPVDFGICLASKSCNIL